MAASPASLRRKIDSAQDLQAIVRAMKAQAAASIGQYERSVAALGDYAQNVELGLSACLRQVDTNAVPPGRAQRRDPVIRAVLFGSDQGLVGRFNDIVQAHASQAMSTLPGAHECWAVGARMEEALAGAGMQVLGVFDVPSSVQAITTLVTQILTQLIAQADSLAQPLAAAEVHLFYNRAGFGATFAPTDQRLLPLDEAWQGGLARQKWPTAMRPEVMGPGTQTLQALLAEYLFVSIFRACAESLASENASRLAAMDRADQNIGKLLGTLQSDLHRLRQESIDEELSDVISGFKALGGMQTMAGAAK
jgi:F-type H+-transporting ATPase subunit gamma